MSFDSFCNELEIAGYDTSMGIIQESIPGLFEFQPFFPVCIVYQYGEWLYSWRGPIGKGSSLESAIQSESELYDLAFAAF